MQPDVVFGVLDMLGAQAGRILVVGCEPASVEDGIGLSEPVAAAVDAAVRVVTRLAADGRPGSAPVQGTPAVQGTLRGTQGTAATRTRAPFPPARPPHGRRRQSVDQ